MDSPADAPPLVRYPCPLCGADDSRPEREIRGYPLEKCRGCGLVFANPRWPDELLEGGYDNQGDHAGEVHSTGDLVAYYERITTGAMIARHDRTLAELEQRLGGPGRLLDFGCGAGYFLERAQKRGWDAHGVELGSWAQEAARRRGVANLHQGLLQEQGFADASFDAVHSSQVLEHLAHPQRELAELHRVLRSGGLFYANVPNYQCLSIVLGRDDFESNHPMGHLNYFTPKTLRALLAQNGFTPQRTSTYGGLKWENILGRRTVRPRGDDPAPAKTEPAAPVPAPEPDHSPPSWKRRLVSPVLDGLLYKGLEVGIELEVLAHRD